MGKKVVKTKEKGRPKVEKKPSDVPSYFVVVPVDQVETILAEGLRGSTAPRYLGEFITIPTVFLLDFDDLGIIDYVVMEIMMPHQYIKEYAILQVSGCGIVGPRKKVLLPGYEHLAGHEVKWEQLAVEQNTIDPEHIIFLETRQIDYTGDEVFAVSQSVSRESKWTTREWEIAETYLDPGKVAERMLIEAQLDGRKLTEDEWNEIEDEAPSVMVLAQRKYESLLDCDSATVKTA